MNELIKPEEEQLYRRVTQILGDARGRVARTVNAEMVNAYWRIGREMLEVALARGTPTRSSFGSRPD